ncbi:MAG: glycoside hydrolase domain-containing protein [Ferruginibacter sp.]
MLRKFLFIACLFFINNIEAQQIKYAAANNNWNADSLGNHRVLLHVATAGNVANATIMWRRPDKHPELKRIIVQDAKTGNKILNVKAGNINRETGGNMV